MVHHTFLPPCSSVLKSRALHPVAMIIYEDKELLVRGGEVLSLAGLHGLVASISPEMLLIGEASRQFAKDLLLFGLPDSKDSSQGP
jgi:hypothetical protein